MLKIIIYGGVKIQKTNGTNDKPLKSHDKDSKQGNESEKIETCYTCGKNFDMNKEDGSRYRYEKFPLCAYCAEFYGFYFDDPGQKRREKGSKPRKNQE
jgi:hypothetical protein